MTDNNWNCMYKEFKTDTFVDKDSYYAPLNIRIGEGTKIGAGTVIRSNVVINHNVKIGRKCVIGNFTLIREYVVLADNVKVGAHCSIEVKAKIGKGTSMQGYCMISEHSKIGEKCFIGPYFNNPADVTIGKPKQPYKPKPAKIGNKVRIGSRVTVTPGKRLNDGCIIGAASLITKNVPRGELWYGHVATKR